MADLDGPKALCDGNTAAGGALWNPRLGEAELRRLLEAGIGMADRAHPARQADLTEHDRVGREGRLGQGRDERRRYRQIGGRLDDAQPAGDIEVDVVGAYREAAAGIEYCGKHRQPRRIPADDGAARGAEQGRRDERLHLDEQRPRALDPGEHRGASGAAARLVRIRRVVPVGEEQGGGVRHLDEAAVAHLEDADLVGRTKAVLDGAQDAELVAALTFEIEHGVDHVLEDAWPGDEPFLRDMADQDDDKAAALRDTDQLLRCAAHLTDRAWGAVERVQIH